MCGIAGFPGAVADVLRHRGPHDDGTWADEEVGDAGPSSRNKEQRYDR